jgi:hypothetical protein
LIKYGEKKMASCYDKYFLGKDISSAQAELMCDIKNRVLFGDNFFELINELERHGLFAEKTFTRKPRGQWTPEYARFLATGFASGYFSRDYLLYCAEIAEYLFQKKRRSKLVLSFGIAGIIVVGLLIVFCRG